ncbi:phage tail tube protein [Pseudomonas sichuanensis]|uniref:phage tail tube protein n=1 Tax=Pseudomonas sichuanensis TaxID=2213015 RepID=UPI002446DBE0|nr:phage tail tube protein [Pseudomonas sichuanensis]MDH0730980.1 phage tail tube protein [Pseudomonas sichuanensis]MDH1581043.1 phage tail tube protein [Pseudomonas sichuanensis]MDH1591096.1 phage tail tube protein [Pseudomonas sichuanensis]MDH1596765.1 phage tail tube protein [Pseudomonas sichuanensis]
MGQRVAGICYVKVDGAQLTIAGSCEARLMDVKRESVVPGFFKEEQLTPYIKCKAVHTPDFPLKKLVEGTDMTVVCEFSNGKVYVLSAAYLVDEPVASGDDGTIDLQFDGLKGVWQ